MPVHDDVPRAIEFIERSVAAEKPFSSTCGFTNRTRRIILGPSSVEISGSGSRARPYLRGRAGPRGCQSRRIAATLDRLDLNDDTLVIFSSDNGPEDTGSPSRRNVNDESTGPGLGTFASVGTTGGHRGRKRSLLQGGIGVPFIAPLARQDPSGQHRRYNSDHRGRSAAHVLCHRGGEVAGVLHGPTA